MNVSPLAQSLMKAGAALAHDDGPGFIKALKAHDWKAVGIDLVVAELTLATAAGLPGAGVALKLVPLAIYLVEHPADPSSPAMSRATGGEGGANISTGA